MLKRKNTNHGETGKSQKNQGILNMSEDQAREHIEKLLWPDGQPVCRHCGSVNAYKMEGKTCRPGLCRCRDCKKQFTVTVGTIFEDSHLPLSTWVKTIHLMASSKKGISALQIQRNLGLGSYRTAWFLCHRIRLAMKCTPMAGMLKGQVQADEAYIGGKYRVGSGEDRKSQYENKTPVLALVETNGKVHSQPMQAVNAATLRSAMQEVIDAKAQIVSDDHSAYPLATAIFEGGHETVNHSKDEYARKQFNNKIGTVETITTNTAESFFSLLKRGHYGVFHKLSKKHLHRYCDEFNFRWNARTLSDSDRRTLALTQVEGKRLMYHQPTGA